MAPIPEERLECPPRRPARCTGVVVPGVLTAVAKLGVDTELCDLEWTWRGVELCRERCGVRTAVESASVEALAVYCLTLDWYNAGFVTYGSEAVILKFGGSEVGGVWSALDSGIARFSPKGGLSNWRSSRRRETFLLLITESSEEERM